MVDYNALGVRVKKLIVKYGRDVQIKRTVEAAPPDPDKPWVKGDPAETISPARGVFDDYPVDKLQSDAFQIGDRKLYVSPNGLLFDPARGDIVSFADEDWGVESVIAVEPAGVKVLWELQVRKWPRRGPTQ